MSERNLHDELIEQFGDDISPQKAREMTLQDLCWNDLQTTAAVVGVHGSGDGATDLREKLAAEGVFHGAVGDDSVYQYDSDEGTVTKLNND